MAHITCHAHNVVRTYYMSAISSPQWARAVRLSGLPNQWTRLAILSSSVSGDDKSAGVFGFRSVNGGSFKKSKPSKWWRYTEVYPASGWFQVPLRVPFFGRLRSQQKCKRQPNAGWDTFKGYQGRYETKHAPKFQCNKLTPRGLKKIDPNGRWLPSLVPSPFPLAKFGPLRPQNLTTAK